MEEIMWSVFVTSVILLYFGEVHAQSVHLVPSPIAEVKEGNTLTLHCSCNGSDTPDFINWYLNNDTFGLVIDASSCKYLISPGQYEIDRYRISCHENEFDLSIASISKHKDHHATWKCDTTVIGMHPPQKASTAIKVIDAGKSGQFDQPITVVVTVALVVPITVIFAVAGYFVHRKRRNDHSKIKMNKDHDKDHEQIVMLVPNRIVKKIDCNQA